MRVCLITAPTVAEFADSAEFASESVVRAAYEPQLGILSLAAMLEVRGDTPRIVDLNRTFLAYSDSVGNSPLSDFAEYAAKAIAVDNSTLYGFSSICSSYPLTIRIARVLKMLRPESTILLGGPQASVVDMQTLAAFPFVDLVLRGEAEHSLPNLLDQLDGDRRLDLVAGLTYRCALQPQRNANANVIEDLDALPSPAYHLTGELHGARRASLELGRGCPFACTFCSTNDFFRRNFRLRSPERLLHDMRSIAAAYSIRDFELVHDMFTVDRRRVAAFCQAMIASGEGFTWSCSARTDRIDEELLDLMARSGCRGIFFGVEAGSQRMQKIIDKHLDPKRAEEVIDATDRAGIGSTVSLITGFPEETWEDLRETMRIFMHSARYPQSHPQLNLLAPLASTPLHSRHGDELVLEDLCSGLSLQSQNQNAADTQLIREYPDIFPNFYIIPAPHLDRGTLLELREFALMGLARFRWLLTAIDQSAAGSLDFYLEWHNFRLQKRSELAGFELRRYYRTDDFQSDFLSFVRSHDVRRAAAVEALLDYEDSMRRVSAAVVRRSPVGHPVTPGAALRWSDKPIKKERVSVIELRYDIQRIVDALKFRSKPVCEPGTYFYVTREVSADIDRLDRVSDWMACLLRLCNGRRRIDEIIPRLSSILSEVAQPLQTYVSLRLLAAAQSQNLIDIYRSVSIAKSDRNCGRVQWEQALPKRSSHFFH